MLKTFLQLLSAPLLPLLRGVPGTKGKHPPPRPQGASATIMHTTLGKLWLLSNRNKTVHKGKVLDDKKKILVHYFIHGIVKLLHWDSVNMANNGCRYWQYKPCSRELYTMPNVLGHKTT